MEQTKQLTPAIAQHIHALWADPCVKHVMRVRSAFSPALLYVDDALGALFDRVLRIASPGYAMTADDYMRTRVTTTGMNQNVIVAPADGLPAGSAYTQLHVLDVGGRKSERKKWRPAQVFSGDTCAYLFVVAASDYDEGTYEDADANRLHDALALFGEFLVSKSNPPPPRLGLG